MLQLENEGGLLSSLSSMWKTETSTYYDGLGEEIDLSKIPFCIQCKHTFAFFDKKVQCPTCQRILCEPCLPKQCFLPLEAPLQGTLQICKRCFVLVSRSKQVLEFRKKVDQSKSSRIFLWYKTLMALKKQVQHVSMPGFRASVMIFTMDYHPEFPAGDEKKFRANVMTTIEMLGDERIAESKKIAMEQLQGLESHFRNIENRLKMISSAPSELDRENQIKQKLKLTMVNFLQETLPEFKLYATDLKNFLEAPEIVSLLNNYEDQLRQKERVNRDQQNRKKKEELVKGLLSKDAKENVIDEMPIFTTPSYSHSDFWEDDIIKHPNTEPIQPIPKELPKPKNPEPVHKQMQPKKADSIKRPLNTIKSTNPFEEPTKSTNPFDAGLDSTNPFDNIILEKPEPVERKDEKNIPTSGSSKNLKLTNKMKEPSPETNKKEPTKQPPKKDTFFGSLFSSSKETKSPQPSTQGTPYISAVRPAIVPLQGNVMVDIQGEHLAHGLDVIIGGTRLSADDVIVKQEGQSKYWHVYATVPPHTPGARTIFIVLPNSQTCSLSNVLLYSDDQDLWDI